MDQIKYSNVVEEITTVEQATKIITEADQMPDTVLKRLMEEVKNDNINAMFAYDRAHNRHNRGR